MNNGDILYKYDLANKTGRQITAYRYTIKYLDLNRNFVKDREGYTGAEVTGENLAPYEVAEGYYVDLTDELTGINCEYIRFLGITNVLFADGTIWRQPVLE